jgi:hypothetical protein
MSNSQSINPIAWVIASCNGTFFPRPGVNPFLNYDKFNSGKPECPGTFRRVFFPAAIVINFRNKFIKSGIRLNGAACYLSGIAEYCPQFRVIESFHFLFILMIYEMG